MKILYITPYKMNDEGVSSGTVVSVKKALMDAGNEVIVIDNLKIPRLFEFLAKVIRKILKKELDLLREPYVIKKLAKEIESRSKGIDYDIVFSQTSVLCAYYYGNKPIVFYTDASFGGMLDYYWKPNEWIHFNLTHGNQVEQLALDRCDKAIYVSEWAAYTAVKFYGVSPSKCVVINRGANIYHQLQMKDIKEAIEKRGVASGKGEYRFLFVGRNWTRKGGPLALETVKKLNLMGYSSKLVVVGCTPNLTNEEELYVEIVGFLNKSIETENKYLQNLFLSSDFYLQPSKQECQGIAYAEASAFGLPVIATNTGGVSGIVTHKNGYLLELNDDAKKYAEKIMELIDSAELYVKLAESAFLFYQEALNWTGVGKRLTNTLNIVIENHKDARY